MCVTSQPSHMSNTLVYGAEVVHDGALKHVLAYQNKARNFGRGANAMLLPIPSAKALGPKSALDLTPYPTILKDYADSVFPVMKSRGFSAPIGAAFNSVHVFESGSYTVVLAQNARDIPRAIGLLPPNRRPAIQQAMFDAYADLYPDWHVALACYDGTIEAEPIAFVYEPMNPSRLFLPALDGHDGNPPNVNAKVDRDHTLLWASQSMRGQKVRLASTMPAHLAPFFPTVAGGTKVRDATKNGDFQVDITGMGEGLPRPILLTTPGLG